ncbi:MAG: cyclase family protein [Bacteroidota bacterium]
MIAQFNHRNVLYRVDLSKPIDISIPIRHGSDNPNCYWSDPVSIKSINGENFIGSVKAGGNVNHNKVIITPHGNGTHTECYGHISDDESATLNACLKQSHFLARLITITPHEAEDGDLIFRLNDMSHRLINNEVDALIIRTEPNSEEKLTRNYSGTNPPYFSEDIIDFFVEKGVKHLLVDLPSLDREVDEGKLVAHRTFWGLPDKIREDCTITELIYVPDDIPDGVYLLNLQTTSLELDVSPSKPVIYEILA